MWLPPTGLACTAVKCCENFTAVRGVMLPRRHPGASGPCRERSSLIYSSSGRSRQRMAASSTSMPSLPGLALRITAKGGKSWCAFYRFHGRLRRFTIGTYPALKPAQARREATAALERVREGFDPAEEKRTRRDHRSPETDTFAAVAHDYLERHLRKNSAASTYKEAKRDLEQNAIAKWANRPVASISRRDVIELIDGIIARGAEIQANRTLARLRAMFNWAMEKDRLAGLLSRA